MTDLYPADDDQFEENTIDKVVPYDDGYEIHFDDGMVFGINKTEGVEPVSGSSVRLYGKGIGYAIRGVFVDGKKVYYRTEEEEKEHGAEIAAKAKSERLATFAEEKPKHDERIAKLPQPFQDRIQGFRERNPEFGPEFEGYELFACEQAVVIAQALDRADAIQEFANLDPEEQFKRVPGLSHDHTGNSMGFAMRMAYVFIDDPDDHKDFIRHFHGALCPLMGCDTYGCWSTTQKAKEDALSEAESA